MSFNDSYILGNITMGDGSMEVVEVDGEEGEPNYVGFIESSLIKMVPKFLKAIVTLLICGLMLLITFLAIKLGKRGCRTHRKLREEKATNGRPGAPLHSVIVTPPDDDPSFEDAPQSSSSLSPGRSGCMKVPKGQLRRASGVFGSEALSFVGEQYTMKKIEKDRHHYKAGHVPGHYALAHHFRSGSSTGNSSSQPNDKSGSSGSSWNCFNSNN